jgi:glutathione synthase/RimK-type ligase-like ATP-grasp enzyme
MFWLHTRTIVILEKYGVLVIANHKLFASANDKFYSLLLPPSFRSLLLAVN